MDTIQTLTDLLKQSQCEFQITELGRRIQPIPQSEFEQIERGQRPWPYPLQRQARFAITYWNELKQPWIWFLNFELDERGLMKPADVGQFIRYILEAMGTRLNQSLTEAQQEKLANNPYTFKPPEDKMALFHSQVRAMLDLPASQYYEHAQSYFKGEQEWDQWQSVGLQGITDICARLGKEQNAVHLIKSLNHLPAQPRYALLGALEHTPLQSRLADRLLAQAEEEARQPEPDIFLLSAYIRALAGSPENQLSGIIHTVLAKADLCHREILIAIAGRCWSVLAGEKLAEQFLIRLAQTGEQSLFNQLFADLVMLPELRIILLPLLHSTASAELEAAITALQHSTKNS
ncbi:hypothetical protein VA7868_02210 [Vibrio aerogenes CECT 7868]|uniref:DUF3549 domain-containing protein n=1 Tax=Vibrio aerogenes CECT 7868 TaxID=1216006 RepID=A0A1M5Z2A0_9VIBR|nr:DUF3549 family protein [Vibrio aerogenes]SHI18370.1 hypothetical protein VA7868_02210 [Vibrio aerogenes CECT 7868]